MTKDTRRWCDDERLHPLLGGMLSTAANDLRRQYPDFKLTNLRFARSAIPEFASAKFIFRVEAYKCMPLGLRPDLAQLAKRQNGSPIWFPTDEFVEKFLMQWSGMRPVLYGDEIIWPTLKLR